MTHQCPGTVPDCSGGLCALASSLTLRSFGILIWVPSGLNYSLDSHLSSWLNTSCPHLLSRAGSSVLCTVPALKIPQHLWVGRVNSLSFPAMTLFLRDHLPPKSPAGSQVVFHLSVGLQNLLSTQNILYQKLFTIFFFFNAPGFLSTFDLSWYRPSCSPHFDKLSAFQVEIFSL